MTRASDYFQELADRYRDERYGPGADPWRHAYFTGRLELARSMLAGIRGRILDLGSGPGILGEAFPDARVFSLDLSPAMAAASGPRSMAADAVRLPVADGTIDAVVALGLTTYVPDLAALLREAARVLVPGGKLVVSFTRREAPDTMLRGVYRALLGGGGGNGILTAGIDVRSRSEGETDRALRAAGFRIVESRTHNFTVFPAAYLLRGASLKLDERLRTSAPDWLGSDRIVLAESAPRRERTVKNRVVRVIARMNVGGPARQAILLTKQLDPERYDSTLVTGHVESHESDMIDEARAAGIEPVILPGLGRAPSLLDDVKAFFGLLAILLRVRPRIVHTHTAKAGALGRVAALLAGVPVRIHTFHGHVLHGYFGRIGSALVRATEMILARLATRIVAVSPEVKSDLAERHRIASPSKIDVVPLGLDLTDLYTAERHRGRFRKELGLAADAPLVVMVGRVTAVKEPEIALEAFSRLLGRRPDARLVIVGGGDLFDAVKAKVEELGLADFVTLAGWRRDLATIFADADLALLTSRNEGTPVALIEAAAAGVPAVATRVGGVPTVVEHGETGLLAPLRDSRALADAMDDLLGDPDRRRAMGAAARERVRARFSGERLLGDIDRLYTGGRYSG